jgi:hypothetical protein
MKKELLGKQTRWHWIFNLPGKSKDEVYKRTLTLTWCEADTWKEIEAACEKALG